MLSVKIIYRLEMIIIFSESQIAIEILYVKAGYKENDYKFNRNELIQFHCLSKYYYECKQILHCNIRLNIEHSYLNNMMNKKYIISSKTNDKSKTSRH